MMVLVFYDVPGDRLRKKIAQACLDQGLERWQFSVFKGDLPRGRMLELEARLRTLSRGQEAVIHIQPVARDQEQKAWIRR